MKDVIPSNSLTIQARPVFGWLRVAAAVVLVSVLWLAGCGGPVPETDLPPTPVLAVDEFPKAVREQLTGALAAQKDAPLDADANGQLGMLLRLYEQPGEAEVFYQRAHLLAPDSFEWTYYLAELWAYRGRQEEAVAGFRQALAMRPNSAIARLALGEALLNLGQLDEAGVLFRGVIQDQPVFGEGHFGLGRVLLQQGEPAAAIEALTRTVDITGPFGRAYYLIASARRQLGQTEQAEADLKAYERYKNVVPPGNDRMMGSIQALNRSDQPLVKRANQLGAAGRVDEAIQVLNQALELNPESLSAHTSLVGVYGSKRDFANAEKHYRLASAINPGIAKLQYNLGIVRLAEQRLVEAREAFQRAIDINAQDADAFAQLGLTFEMSQQPDEAYARYLQALTVDPAHRQSHWQLGRLLNERKQHDKAIEHLLQAVEPPDPASGMIRRELATAYSAIDQKDQARATLETALQVAEEIGSHTEAVLIRRDLRDLQADSQ